MEAALGALQPLDPEERQRVSDWLAAKLGLEGSQPSGGAGREGAAGVDAGETPGTIKQFLKQKRPDDDVARAAALAYYLTHRKSQATFKTADLTKSRVEAALV